MKGNLFKKEGGKNSRRAASVGTKRMKSGTSWKPNEKKGTGGEVAEGRQIIGKKGGTRGKNKRHRKRPQKKRGSRKRIIWL